MAQNHVSGVNCILTVVSSLSLVYELHAPAALDIMLEPAIKILKML